MPELPEVQCTVDRIRKHLRIRRILDFKASWPRQVSPGIRAVHDAVVGRTVIRVERRGKHILLSLDSGGVLGIHLGMSGRLAWEADCEEPPSYVRAVLTLAGGRLLFCDARKFGRIRYASGPDEICGRLGPEPLSRSFTVRGFHLALLRRARGLKALLLDQGLVAGLGNIYTDEALFQARLHPLLPANRISSAQARLLHLAIRQVLRRAIRNCGTSLDWVYPGGRMQGLLQVYGRGGEPCPRCRSEIRVIRVNQRSTHFCPSCQARRHGSR